MNIRNNKLSSDTELVYIEGIGFMFEVNPKLKHNLINPDVLAFFDGVPESEEVTQFCAFPLEKAKTNLKSSNFHNLGYAWAICSDGLFRKCRMIKCNVQYNNQSFEITFCIDKSLHNQSINGFVSSQS